METQPSQNLDSPWSTQTKFVSPRLRGDFVPCRLLLDSLPTPACYCKTAILTSFASTFPDTSVAWISLDEDDPVILDDFHLIIEPATFSALECWLRQDAKEYHAPSRIISWRNQEEELTTRLYRVL